MDTLEKLYKPLLIHLDDGSSNVLDVFNERCLSAPLEISGHSAELKGGDDRKKRFLGRRLEEIKKVLEVPTTILVGPTRRMACERV